MYFPSVISVMVNLIQSAYHGTQPTSRRGHSPESLPDARGEDSRLATVIYFSTFVDLLLEHFLENVADALPIPRGVYERLMSDHMYARVRTEKLFPALTGQTWRQALTRVSKNDGCDYAEVAQFAKEVAQKRNALLHEGDKWAISEELPEQCINRSSQLADLFVALHNEYVFPLYQKSGKPYFVGPQG